MDRALSAKEGYKCEFEDVQGENIICASIEKSLEDLLQIVNAIALETFISLQAIRPDEIESPPGTERL